MKNWFNIKITLYIYLLVISIFTVFRIMLFITNAELVNTIEEDKWLNIFLSFITGIRFDIVISGYVLLLPFLIFSVLFSAKISSNIVMKILFYYIFIMFTIAFTISAIDIPYFNQFFARLSISALQWVDSPAFVFKMIIQEPRYWLIIIPFLILIVIFFVLLKKIFTNFQFNRNNYFTSGIFLKIILSLLFAGIMFIGIRGRLQKKSPIRVGTAYFSKNSFINKAGLNPVFTFLRSYIDTFNPKNDKTKLIDNKFAIKEVQKYFNITEIDKNNPIARKIIPDTVATNKKNVVIVIMESMSAAKMTRYGNPNNLTPFLDSLANNSYSFDNFYSAGIHTFNGIHSTLFSYPALFRQHPMTGIDMLKYNGIANVLKKHDYSSIYFTTHDGQFDNVEGFMTANDYDEVVSQANFPSDKIKSTLGVSDDYLFEFAIPKLNNLNNKGKPFIAALMTASDHGPYIVPEYFKPKSKDLKKQIVEYADWSLRKFLNMASKQKWYDNTIFVFVADHGASMNAIYEMPLNYNHIPLIIYTPNIKARKIKNFGGQIDIFPTVMGLLNLPYTNNTMGIDLLKNKRHYMYFCADDKYGVIDDEFFLIVRGESKSLFKYKTKDKTNYISDYQDIANKMDKYAKSNMQVSQFIIENNLQYISD